MKPSVSQRRVQPWNWLMSIWLVSDKKSPLAEGILSRRAWYHGLDEDRGHPSDRLGRRAQARRAAARARADVAGRRDLGALSALAATRRPGGRGQLARRARPARGRERARRETVRGSYGSRRA